MKRCAYVIKDGFVSAVIDMIPYNISSDHQNYAEIVAALRNDNADTAISLIDAKKVIEEYTNEVPGIEIRGNSLYFNDEQMHGVLVDQIFAMMKLGEDAEPLKRFFVNLQSNPSYRAVNELYGWMEKAGITSITPDGCFLAYKRVADDYTDIHTGTFDNSIGSVVAVPRNRVDENPNKTCSYGLHFCSYDYLNSYANSPNYKTLIVKVNPADVVAIPTDYQNAKGRCCRYEVISEVPHGEHVLTKAVDKTPAPEKKPVHLTEIIEKHTLKELASVYKSITGNGPKEFKSKAKAFTRIERDCDLHEFKGRMTEMYGRKNEN